MLILILVGIVLLDQATKYIAYVYLQPQNTIPIINKFFYLTYLENKGAAFGILKDKTWLLTVITVVVLITAASYVYYNHKMNRTAKVSVALIIAGATGNLIDRVRLGFVIDFFDFSVWPIFNIADISVVLGAIVLSLILIFKKQEDSV